jgi:acyl-CoA reductase-like NAD-dependent aldehyde dehydrogenase
MDIEQALNWADHYAFASSQDREQFECMTRLAQEVREMRASFIELARLCNGASLVEADYVEALIKDYVQPEYPEVPDKTHDRFPCP